LIAERGIIKRSNSGSVAFELRIDESAVHPEFVYIDSITE